MSEKIKFKDKEFIVLDKEIPSGGGSDSIRVVLDKEKYDKILNNLIECAKEVKRTQESIAGKLSNIKNKTPKEEILCWKKIIKQSIEKYLNNKKLDKIEKRIMKEFSGENYLQSMKHYNFAKRINKRYNQGILIERPENDTAIFVIKKFSTQKLKKTHWKTRFENEIRFSKEVKSKYIIKYLDSEYLYNSQVEKPSLCALMPFYPKTLRDVINDRDTYTFDSRLKMVVQLCQALKYIHKRNMWHRDIKPENIFVDTHNNIVLADFGIAHFSDSNITVKRDDFKNRAYAAPEQLIKNNHTNIGPHTDIYSLGLIINELFTGNVPRADDYEKIEDYYPQYKWLDSLVSSMIKQSVGERISDIRTVINEINLFKAEAKNKQLYVEYSNVLNIDFVLALKLNRFSKKKQDEIVKLIERDLFIAKNIFETKSKDELKKYEINYHSIIGYKLSDELTNIIIQCLAYKACLNKFKYESNSLDSYKSIDNNNKWYKLLKSLFDTHKSKYIDLSCLTLKYFLSCCDYHCEEIINDITSQIENILKDLNDSPILYLITKIRSLLTEDIYNKLKNDKHFFIERNFYPIKIHNDVYSTDDIYHVLADFELKQKGLVINLMKSKYKAYIQDSKNKMSVLITFNSLKKYDKFLSDCFNNLKNISKEKRYVTEGDLLDIRKKTEFGYQTYRITLNEYDIKLLIRIFDLETNGWV